MADLNLFTLYVSDNPLKKIWMMDGFSNTVVDSLDYNGVLGQAFGIALLEGDLIVNDRSSPNYMYRFQGFSLTISDTFAIPPSAPQLTAGVFIDEKGDIYFGNDQIDKIFKLDGFSPTILDSITVNTIGTFPVAVAWYEGNLYMGNTFPVKHIKFNGFSTTITDSFTNVGVKPYGRVQDYTIDPDGNFMYTVNDYDNVVKMSGWSTTVLDSFQTGGGAGEPEGVHWEFPLELIAIEENVSLSFDLFDMSAEDNIAVTEVVTVEFQPVIDLTTFYTVDAVYKKVWRLDGFTPTIADSFSIEGQIVSPFGVIFYEGDTYVLERSGSRGIYKYVGFTSTIADTIPVAGSGGVSGLDVDGEGNFYFACWGNNKVYKIDGFSTTVLDSLSVTDLPTACSWWEGNLYTHRTITDKHVKHLGWSTTITDSFVRTPESGSGIAWTPDGKYIYADYLNDYLHMLDGFQNVLLAQIQVGGASRSPEDAFVDYPQERLSVEEFVSAFVFSEFDLPLVFDGVTVTEEAETIEALYVDLPLPAPDNWITHGEFANTVFWMKLRSGFTSTVLDSFRTNASPFSVNYRTYAGHFSYYDDNLYFTNGSAGNKFFKLDGFSNTILDSLSPASTPYSVYRALDGSMWAGHGGQGYVTKYNGFSLTITDTLDAVHSFPYLVTMDKEEENLFTAELGTFKIRKWDGFTPSTVTDSLSGLGIGNARGINFDSGGNLLVATITGASWYRYQGFTSTLLDSLKDGYAGSYGASGVTYQKGTNTEDVVSVEESVQAEVFYLIVVHEDITVTEDYEQYFPVLGADTFDAVSITEFVDMFDPIIELGIVYEDITITEDTDFQGLDNAVDVSDDILVTEVVIMNDLVIELGVVAEIISVIESPELSIDVLYVDINDLISIADVVFTEFDLPISFDSLTVAEDVELIIILPLVVPAPAKGNAIFCYRTGELWNNIRIRKASGFSSTILDSFDPQVFDIYPTGVAYYQGDVYLAGDENSPSKVYRLDGFSADILDSFNIVPLNMRDIHMDSDGNLYSAGSGPSLGLYRYVGFTSTIDQTFNNPNIVYAVCTEYGGSSQLYSGGGDSGGGVKMYAHAGGFGSQTGGTTLTFSSAFANIWSASFDEDDNLMLAFFGSGSKGFARLDGFSTTVIDTFQASGMDGFGVAWDPTQAFDGITVTEFAYAEIIAGLIIEQENITIVENVLLDPFLALHYIDVNDLVSVAEFVSILDIIIEVPLVFDSVGVTEDISISLDTLNVSVLDPFHVLITESISVVDLIVEVGVVMEAITVVDEASVSLPELNLEVSDTITATEFITMLDEIIELGVVFDTITVAEFDDELIDVLVPDVSDLITITEFATVFDIIIELGIVYEDITVSEFVEFTGLDHKVDVFDAVVISEFVSLLDIVVELDAQENISVTENVTPSLDVLYLDVNDAISITEVHSEYIDILNISNFESITVTEYLNMLDEIIDIGILFESIGISEFVDFQGLDLNINIFDSVNVTEFVNLSSVYTFYILTVSDVINISEFTNWNMPINFEVAEQRGVSIVTVSGW